MQDVHNIAKLIYIKNPDMLMLLCNDNDDIYEQMMLLGSTAWRVSWSE